MNAIASGSCPKVSFGIIVLNGEPFTRYNLRSLYPFAHEIIVAEGASPYAAHVATPDGHSIDGTLEVLEDFKAHEDPEGKLTLVTAEDEGHPNGFWPGEKDEQSQAYARRATGDWLWQVDIDEFYHGRGMKLVLDLLASDPTITAITFPEIPFWGSFDICCEGIALAMGYSQFHRLFKWGPGYVMATHRPPTVLNEKGTDLRRLHWVTARDMERLDVRLYHYSQLFPTQVRAKMTYYDRLITNTHRARRIMNVGQWFRNSFLSLHNPYYVHTVNTSPSWLVQFCGEHPAQIQRLRMAIEVGELPMRLRDMHDVKSLLASSWYAVGITCLKAWTNYVLQPHRVGRDFLKRRLSGRDALRQIWLIAVGKDRIFPS